MATQEIKETNWDLFTRRFEEAHRGTLISIDTVSHDGRTESLARQLPLREFRFEKTEGCSDVIRVELGETANRTVQHSIVEPIHLRIREDAGGSKILLIDAESGSAELKFSSGRIGAILSEMGMAS
jgi:hypothetical protein